MRNLPSTLNNGSLQPAPQVLHAEKMGCLEFMEQLRIQQNGLDLRITTNGTRLLPYLPRLRNINIGGINLSLDTLATQ